MEENNYELIDEGENYRGRSKDEKYSHEVLVMLCMKRCLEAGNNEMRPGYFNTRTDQNGNTIKTYIEDTRKAFVESVKSLEMQMYCDLDQEAIDKIKEIMQKLNTKFKNLCQKEFEEWNNITIKIRNERWKKGIFYHHSSLNTHLYFYQEFIEQQVEHYREIFKELNKLTLRLEFYNEDDSIEN